MAASSLSLPAWPKRGELPVPLPPREHEQQRHDEGRRARPRDNDDEAQQHVEEEDMGLAPEVTDVVAALGLLAQRLHSSSNAPPSIRADQRGHKRRRQQGGAPSPPPPSLPVVLQHQLYTVLDDATAVDVELEALRRQNFVRLLKLLTQRQADVAVCLTSAYLARIQEAIDQCAALALAPVPAAPAQAASSAASEQEEQEQQEREEAQGRQQQAESEERIYALRFLREAVGRFTSLSVTRPELESAMAAFSARRPPPATASAGSSKSQQQQPQQHKARPLVDRAVRPLLKLGFLARRVDSRMEEAYWFSAPELGRATAALPAGRKAILAALRRSRYKELSERNVQALDLNPRGSGVAAAAVAGTALSPEFYVADLVGAKEVLAVDTSSGRFLRLPPGAATAASAAASASGGRRMRGR